MSSPSSPRTHRSAVLLVLSALAGGLVSPVGAAFVGFFDAGTSTLTLTQSFDDGNVTIDNNGGSGVFRTIDGAGTVGFVAAQNLIVNLFDGTGKNDLGLRTDLESPGIANVTSTVLELLGFEPPDDYLPSLNRRRN